MCLFNPYSSGDFALFTFLKRFVNTHRVLLGFVLLQYIVSFAYVTVLDYGGFVDLQGETIFMLQPLDEFIFAVCVFPIACALFLFLKGLIVPDKGDMTSLKRFTQPERLVSAVLVSIILYFVILPFGQIKSLIRHVAFYPWDDVFMHADFIVHMGHFPHDLLYALMPPDIFMPLIDLVYVWWFLTLYFVTASVLYRDSLSFRRHHFLLAFVMVWGVIGNGLATLLSSAGPIFYGLFHGHVDSYSQAFEAMKARDLIAVDAYGLLVDFLNDDKVIDLNGPSAMPSVHVAMAAIIFFYCRQYGTDRQKLFSFLFLLMIMIGAVYLLWHYAVDVYFAFIAAYGVWRLAEYLVRRYQPELVRRDKPPVEISS